MLCRAPSAISSASQGDQRLANAITMPGHQHQSRDRRAAGANADLELQEGASDGRSEVKAKAQKIEGSFAQRDSAAPPLKVRQSGGSNVSSNASKKRDGPVEDATSAEGSHKSALSPRTAPAR